MSPDGRYIVYISNRNGVENIYRMNADGSNEMQLTNGSGEYTPRVTADSKWVLYSGDFSGRRSLWKVSIDGGTPLQLTDRKAMQPDISLDGSLVAFCYLDDQKNPKWRVGVMAMTGERRIKSFDLPKSIIRWLPGEHALTFINNIDSYTNIWAHTLDGKKPRPLTKFDSSQIISFDWSRDGKQLVMLRDSPRKYVVLFED
jgi:TolB protein